MTMLRDIDGGIATLVSACSKSYLSALFSYADKAAQWSNNELIQLQVDGTSQSSTKRALTKTAVSQAC
jgi:hypothetical protein